MFATQPEVIPVDTHVHQIAVKHYGMSTKSKMTMSPKLYDEVNNRLAAVWGPYAGWAHSVRCSIYSEVSDLNPTALSRFYSLQTSKPLQLTDSRLQPRLLNHRHPSKQSSSSSLQSWARDRERIRGTGNLLVSSLRP